MLGKLFPAAVALGAATLILVSGGAASATTAYEKDNAGVDEKLDWSGDVADVSKWSASMTQTSLKFTVKFKKYEKKSVRYLVVDVRNEAGTEFWLDMPREDATPGLYYPGTYSAADLICAADVERTYGKNGTLRLTIDRSCLDPEGEGVDTWSAQIDDATVGDSKSSGTKFWSDGMGTDDTPAVLIPTYGAPQPLDGAGLRGGAAGH